MKLLFFISALVCTTITFTQDGVLDTSFGTNGLVTNDLGWGDVITKLLIQPDNKIIAVGYTTATSSAVIARYLPNGSVDTSFGTNGFTSTKLGNESVAYDAVLLIDGSVIVTGYAVTSTDRKYVVIKYTKNGSLDTTFGSGGSVITDLGGNDIARAIVVQNDGKIIIAGGAGSGNNCVLVRYESDGSIDTSFGTNGIVTTNLGGSSSAAYAMILQSDGNIVIGGIGGGSTDFALARYLPDGTLDTSFGTNGITTTNAGGSDVIESLVQQPDGSFIAAGRGNSPKDFVVAKYTANGLLDTSFGTNGLTITNIDGVVVFDPFDFGGDDPRAVVIQPDGKIIVGGASGSPRSFTMVRYLDNGTLDTSFGTNGIETTPGTNGGLILSLLIQPDGKLLAGGIGGANSDFMIARYELPSIQIPRRICDIRAKYFMLT